VGTGTFALAASSVLCDELNPTALETVASLTTVVVLVDVDTIGVTLVETARFNVCGPHPSANWSRWSGPSQ
jgi:hypothetical protein